jgi:probable HAF family extracellular repeat protein
LQPDKNDEASRKTASNPSRTHSVIQGENIMKPNISRTKFSRIVLFALTLPAFAAPVSAQQMSAPPTRYNITDLGTLGGGFSEAVSVNNRGLVSGSSALPDGTTHAVLWQKGHIIDIGTIGLGGPASNSRAFDANERGQAAGAAETSTPDPNGEDFCSFGTHFTCPSFLWQNNVMTPLRTLGGNNNFVFAINNRGQVAGVSENNTHDASCAAPFQLRDFEAAIWGPGPGSIRALQPLGGDTVGEATWINDLGQAVGSSGSCANTVLPPLAAGPHAVLWENGVPTDLGNLGGTCTTPCISPVLGPYGNTPLYINDQGQVVGLSALTGDATFHAFLWTKTTGMQDLQTLPGDLASVGLAINSNGEAVGLSLDQGGNPRAFLWRNGVMTDLNALVPADSPFLVLFVADVINSSGEIAGFGLTSSFEVHGFLATPSNGAAVSESTALAPLSSSAESTNTALRESVHKILHQRLRLGRFGIRPLGPQ